MKRPNKDTYYLDIALAVSKRSTCLKRHYGCVIVKDDVIVATGYNGSPRGEVNCCDSGVCKRSNAEKGKGYDECPAVHAEQNALLAVDRAHSQGATLYLACEEAIKTCGPAKVSCYDCTPDCRYKISLYFEEKSPKPCSMCAKMIKNAGIMRVVTREGDSFWD